jgi:peptidyl-prolyl cis-trans isomerase A (cyclophilin A)
MVRGSRGIALAAVIAVLVTGCERGCPDVEAPQVSAGQRVLLDPAGAALKEIPPDTYRVRLETSAGDILVEVVRAWAAMGAYRFYNLVRNGFYDGSAFYRVMPGFMAQFGVHAVPEVQMAWLDETIPDDPVQQSNVRGTVTFAKAGKNTRTTQLFINYGDNSRLDELGFAPIGHVVSGMDVADRLYGAYGETAPQGEGPDYACMLSGGSAYLADRFERLDIIERATIERL